MGTLPFALQLFTVRDHLKKNPGETLKKVKHAGYDYVELAGTVGLGDSEFKKLLEDAQLEAMCAHFGLEPLQNEIEGVIETCRLFNLEYAVCPHAKAEDKAGWVNIAKALDAAGAKLRNAGIQLGYHNHAHEFETFDGEYAFDIIFNTASPENLVLEIDTFWVKYGKADPVAKLNQYSGRCPLVHVKDMAPEGEDPVFADLGSGTMDWPPIFAAAKQAGAKWYIVEQDACKGDSLDSAKAGAQFMAKQ
jgi:sugar phosphate isomerase/epimerase